MDTFEKYLVSENIIFKYAKGVSSKTGKEFHAYHEIILFLEEGAHLFSETVSAVIKSNTLIIIPKETYHQLNIIGYAKDYKRCVLHFSDIPALEPIIKKCMTHLYITEPNSTLAFLFDKLKKSALFPQDNSLNGILLNAVLSLILTELGSEKMPHYTLPAINPTISKCISYITENINGDLSIINISNNLHISGSLLSHLFKHEMNISIHKYILKKRLTLAFEKISSGVPAAIAARECGFNEYSNFYRQYKKVFGFSPSSKNTLYKINKQAVPAPMSHSDLVQT